MALKGKTNNFLSARGGNQYWQSNANGETPQCSQFFHAKESGRKTQGVRLNVQSYRLKNTPLKIPGGNVREEWATYSVMEDSLV